MVLVAWCSEIKLIILSLCVHSENEYDRDVFGYSS